MWSGPRNLSTALMRSFENRKDTIVLDEPFYSYYLNKTGLKHPMYKEIIKTYSIDENKIIKKITKIPKDHKIFYQKHMTHHILEINNLEWLNIGKNCFLIRHPAKVINSYLKKHNLTNIRDIGFKKQFDIFQYVRKNFDLNPIIINSDDILKNPKKILKKLCDNLKIEFNDSMTNWPKGARDSDGIWGLVWYEKVNNSTSFEKYSESTLDVPKKYYDIYNECLEIFNYMNEFAL